MSTSTEATRRSKYFGDWSDHAEMVADFDGRYEVKYEKAEPNVEGMAKKGEVLFACYTYENYSGSAFVLFKRDGKLFEVNGGHCSCHGLEGQWSPEETTWAALAMRKWEYGVEDPGGRAHLTRMIGRNA